MSKFLVKTQMAIFRLKDLKDERGATTVEYALIVAGVVGIVAAAVALFRTQITNFINSINLG